MNKISQDTQEIELSIVMPCLNEEKTIGICIQKAQSFLKNNHVYGEIIVADNGSSDQSVSIAEESGARVVHISQKGYGSALLGGIDAAQGKYIIMGDADDSYNFLELMPFVEKLREGYELVMGNRFLGGIEAGAMPFLHRYLGNPILSGIGRLFFKIPVKDFHCGLRGFSRDSIKQLNLQTTGMEFASEMVIKASLSNLKICEVPTTLFPDGRDRPPHLRTWRDGWRHLRFMLLYSPRWLFFYPGIILFALGLLLSILISFLNVTISQISFDIHSLAYFNAFIIVGFNMVLFAVLSRIYGYRAGLLPNEPTFSQVFKYVNLECGLLFGALMIVVGFSLGLWALIYWGNTDFGNLDPKNTMRIVIPSITIFLMGTQVALFSFFFSILGIHTSKFDQ